MELDTGFKDRLKWAINSKQTNQSELARAIGTTAQAVQQWVSGATSSPRRDHLEKASAFMGVRYEWLLFGRGPMRLIDMVRTQETVAGASDDATETTLLSHEWETSLLAALPPEARAGWQAKLCHPSGNAQIRISWVSETIISELGLYKHSGSLISSGRQRLWLLAVARALLPATGCRAVLLLAPLEGWREAPDRHIDALRAEARLLGIEVIHASTPEHAAAVLLGQEDAPGIPASDDLGLDVSSVL